MPVSDDTAARPPSRLDDLSRPQAFEDALSLLTDATDALLDDVRRLDDAAVRRPSLCTGWTRAHVLAHVARNADAMVNLVTSASTGLPRAMYASQQARDGDIEAGAGRSAAELEADVESSAERFLAALVDLPADRLTARVEGRSGTRLPAHDLLWMRLREVVYHHVDLDTGAAFEGQVREVVARGLAEVPPRLEAGGAPGMTWHVADPDPAPAEIEVAGGGLVVRGTAADLLGWGTGRSGGEGLTTEGAALPRLPDWG